MEHKKIQCFVCEGSGIESYFNNHEDLDSQICFECNGRGYLLINEPTLNEEFESIRNEVGLD